MKESVTQKSEYGCGAACVAFVLNREYEKIVERLGAEKASNTGFTCKELVEVLNEDGQAFCYKHIKTDIRQRMNQPNTIVFIKRCKKYPAGHYLVREENYWMDSWLNFKVGMDVERAKSGYRKRLPGKPIYVLFKK